MLFWFAVTPRSRALIAHSTAGQWSVVKRAPIPRVLVPSLARGRGEEGRLRIVLLDPVLEPEEVLPGRGKKHALLARDPVREGPRPIPLSGAHELPRAVPAHRVLKEGPGAVRRRKGRLRVPDQARRGPGRELRGKRPPIEAVVRADAGVVRDQLAVADENAVDQLHG